VTRPALARRLCVAAALAAVVLCVFEGLPDAGLGADDLEAATRAAAAAARAAADAAPPPAANPDAGPGLLARRRARHWKRLGLPASDGGVPERDAGAVHDAVAVPRGMVMAPAAPPPAPAPTTPAAPPVTDLGFNRCQKIPRGKKVVKMNLKPDADLTELIAWISSITCKTIVLPGQINAGSKKITVVSQGPMTRDEAFAAFLTALDTLGLTVERGPGYLKIIEAAKAKTSSTPVYGFDGQPTTAK
jgi:hypothetical protein